MRHYKKGRKLGTDSSHTKAIKKNLLVAIFTNDRIKTIDARAKEMRTEIDRIITWAKKGDLHSRRLAIAAMGDKELVREVFEKAKQGMWADRNGGYTRILKLGPRKGDNAPMVILELVTEPVAGAAPAKSTKKAATKKAAAKKEEAKEEKADKAAEEVAEEAAEEVEATEDAAEAEAEEEAGAAEEATEEAAEEEAAKEE
jgi:large subunit ribosomal protein L17